ncbi:transglycosylase SLT domain-containing protein [Bacteriovoracaceae bacterium]|nr:transglycosylase SLT domain-containing protein [Bacteriovoracaceae bacterium]
MKILANILFLFLTTPTFSFVDPDSIGSLQIEYESAYSDMDFEQKFTTGDIFLSPETVQNILTDYKDQLDKDFEIKKYFADSVKFWFYIYTQFTSDFVVIHDKSNLSLIYNILDYRDFKNDKINRWTLYHLRNRLVSGYTFKLKKTLLRMSKKSPGKYNSEEKILYDKIKAQNPSISKGRKRRSKYLTFLANNIRTQTGQRNLIRDGVLRAAPYLNHLTNMAKNFKIPPQLLAIPFLESSFNPRAASKVGASGIWQIMPYIAKKFFPKPFGEGRYQQDYRNNIVVASVGAFHLLRENKQILKHWDLAIPAYNSGTKHIQLAQKKFGKKKANSLEFILKNYKHPHIGFASKNFYSEFTALAYVLSYRDIIYPGLKKFLTQSNSEYFIYLSKCKQKLKPKDYEIRDGDHKIDFFELNRGIHFKRDKNLGKGSILITQKKLSAKSFYQIKAKTYRRKLPIKWKTLVKNQSCSTK